MEVTVEEVKVKFPLQPYPQQTLLLQKVVKALKDSSNCLVESPTGTGKTLALLCGTLGWQQHHKHECQPCKTPRIFYLSRTQQQLGQVARELNGTGYRNASMTLLAARKHMCVNDPVRLSPDINGRCSEEVAAGQCPFYPTEKKASDVVKRGRSGAALDIEELHTICRREKICPYYATRDMLNGAEIILCPYSYILNESIRESLSLDVTGDVLIFDEGHNLLEAAREAAGVQVTRQQLVSMTVDLKNRLGLCDGVTGDVSLAAARDMCDLRDLVGRVMTTLTECASVTGTVLPAEEMLRHASDWLGRFKTVKDLQSCVRRLRLSSHLKYSTIEVLEAFLSCLARMETAGPTDFRMFFRRHRGGDTDTMNIWCLNSALVMRELSGARSVIVASGTMSPMVAFLGELGLPFREQLENSHVISSDQLLVASVAVGPGHGRIVTSFAHENDPVVLGEVGQSLLQICRVAPGGVVVFTRSYGFMDKLINHLKSRGLWEQLLSIKETFEESRDVSIFPKVSSDFKRAAKSQRGALLLAVYKGKFSEGFDFQGPLARVVVAVGIAYPNVKDQLVTLKREYNKNHCAERAMMTGDEWYLMQGNRAEGAQIPCSTMALAAS